MGCLHGLNGSAFDHRSIASGFKPGHGYAFKSIYFLSLKGTVHPQKILKKYVMLRTVTKNSTILIPKYT